MESDSNNKRGGGKRASRANTNSKNAIIPASNGNTPSSPAVSNPVTNAVPASASPVVNQNSGNINMNMAALMNANPLVAQMMAQNLANQNQNSGIDISSQQQQQQQQQQQMQQIQQQLLVRMAMQQNQAQQLQQQQAQMNPQVLQAFLNMNNANNAANNANANNSINTQLASVQQQNSNTNSNISNQAQLMATLMANRNDPRVQQFLTRQIMAQAAQAANNGINDILHNNVNSNSPNAGTNTNNFQTTNINQAMALANMGRTISPNIIAMLQQTQNANALAAATNNANNINNGVAVGAAVSETPASIHTASPAASTTVENQQQQSQSQPSQPQSQLRHLNETRNQLLNRFNSLQDALNNPNLSEIDKVTMVLNRIGTQIQILQIDHVTKAQSGAVITEQEAAATKLNVQHLKAQMEVGKKKLSMLQARRQQNVVNNSNGDPGNSAVNSASTPLNAMSPPTTGDLNGSGTINPNQMTSKVNLSVAPIAQFVNNTNLQQIQQQMQLQRQRQQEEAARSTLLPVVQSPAPQQSRKIFGGLESFVGGGMTGSTSTVQGFLQTRALPQRPIMRMEESLQSLLDDERPSEGIYADGQSGAKRKLNDLVSELDTEVTIDGDVQDVNNFIDELTQMACKVAKHRNSTVVKPKDFQFPLERNWNIRIPTASLQTLSSLRAFTSIESPILVPVPPTTPVPVSAEHDFLPLLTSRSIHRRGPSSNHMSRVLHVRRALRDEQTAVARQKAIDEAKARAAEDAKREKELQLKKKSDNGGDGGSGGDDSRGGGGVGDTNSVDESDGEGSVSTINDARMKSGTEDFDNENGDDHKMHTTQDTII
ncbi:Transcription initiation factor TFIID subunit 12 [Physocladia obscura]|uniref:Transcription initiation factor TFIID subunit 12 n=1 Tax=Physocladia obscura TaxID=109957 RepID=A0AAD5TBC1_9FUNG|nr:Transcription initiation factor TFIID subunit 12 [Physocladia obscura]